ncbi:MAG: hypothetical protein ACO2ER_06950 [Castellaniella sp.]
MEIIRVMQERQFVVARYHGRVIVERLGWSHRAVQTDVLAYIAGFQSVEVRYVQPHVPGLPWNPRGATLYRRNSKMNYTAGLWVLPGKQSPIRDGVAPELDVAE